MEDLNAQQTRQLLDCEQLFATFRATRDELAQRFSGSMTWKSVKGREYLYRKTGDAWKSIGPRTDETEQAFHRFRSAREDLRLRRASLDDAIRAMAPVNRAMRLGRVPFTSARVLRRLDRIGLLDRELRVVGTHALYAYERLGGVHFGDEAVATQDLDLLYDARASLKLAGGDIRRDGLLGILQALDATFRPTEANSFRAVNAKGFMVDLITPSTRTTAIRPSGLRMSERPDDLAAAEIEGLTWLESSPAITQVAIDERGYPLVIAAPDPRAFACHKAWIASRDDRESLKRRRDRAQASTLIEMLATRLPAMRFDDPALKAVPLSLMEAGRAIAADFAKRPPGHGEDWDD